MSLNIHGTTPVIIAALTKAFSTSRCLYTKSKCGSAFGSRVILITFDGNGDISKSVFAASKVKTCLSFFQNENKYIILSPPLFIPGLPGWPEIEKERERSAVFLLFNAFVSLA